MIGTIIKTLGGVNEGGTSKGGNIVDTIKGAEETETGQYALSLIKGAVTTILIIVGIGTFMFIRTTNKMFGETQKMIGETQEKMNASGSKDIQNRLFEYYREKYPNKTNTEILNQINTIL